MAYTREQAFEALAALNPAPVFLDSYQATRLPEDLDVHFGPPEEFFMAPDHQEQYTRGRLIPILDDGNFGVITFYDPHARNLVQVSVEAPDEVRATLQCWQQYLADLMLGVGDSVDEDQQIRRIADLIQFRYVDRLFELWAQSRVLPSEEYWALRDHFAASIPCD